MSRDDEKPNSRVRKSMLLMREERLAAALRENLRRRKVAKALEASARSGDTEGDDEGTLDDRD